MCPLRVSSRARVHVDFTVQHSGDIGSPRSFGSTRDSSTGRSPGSRSATRLPPPPGRRTHPNGASLASNSDKPLRTVVSLIPAAHATARISPCPSNRASPPVIKRLCRSSRCGNNMEDHLGHVPLPGLRLRGRIRLRIHEPRCDHPADRRVRGRRQRPRRVPGPLAEGHGIDPDPVSLLHPTTPGDVDRPWLLVRPTGLPLLRPGRLRRRDGRVHSARIDIYSARCILQIFAQSSMKITYFLPLLTRIRGRSPSKSVLIHHARGPDRTVARVGIASPPG